MKAFLSIVLLVVLVPLRVRAQTTLTDVVVSFGGFVGLLFPLILALSLAAFLWGMTRFIFEAGSEDGREKGRRVMVWGIIALFVTVSLWGIVTILLTTFGLSPEGNCPPPSIEGGNVRTC